MKKRILSLILAVATLLSLCSISVYAKAPGVETLSAIDIEETSAVLRGKVTSNSGIKIKEYGFEFVSDGNVSYKKFYAGKDFDYPDPINNDIIEYEKGNLKSNKEYCYQFYAINENGEKTIGKSVYFQTEGDDEEPEITKLKSSEGNSFYEGTEVTFSASAEDNNEIDKIYLFIDGEVVAKKSSSSVKYTTDELEAGKYEIAAMAEDKTGNESDVEYLTITVKKKTFSDTPQQGKGETKPDSSYDIVDSTPPTITILSPSNGETINKDVQGTINYSIKATDNVGVKSIEFYQGGTKYDYSYSDTLSSKFSIYNMDLGKAKFEVVATDTSGNKSTKTFYIVIDENEEVKLGKPNVTVKDTYLYTGEKLYISWNKVSNADYYTIQDWTNDKYYDYITSTSYNKISFDEPGTYSLSVFARSYNNSVYKQSEPYAFNVTVVEEDDDDEYTSLTTSNDDFHSFSPTPQQGGANNDPYYITMYALDGRTVQVHRVEAEAYSQLGWYYEPVIVMYALDGRTTVVGRSQEKEYSQAGWYYEPMTLMYALDGRTAAVRTEDEHLYTQWGWYYEPMTVIYASDGRNAIVPTKDVYLYRQWGWYTR